MKRTWNIAMILALTTLAWAASAAWAGSLEPTAPPGPTMKTLQEVYDKLMEIDGKVSSCLEARVPKTGQTATHATGDDGDLQKGAALPRPRFKDNNDGTVTDNLTGLIWLKNANAAGPKNWADAIAYCNALAAPAAGLTDGSKAGDWRLPNLFELESLRNMAYANPCISNTAGTAQWTAGDPFDNVLGVVDETPVLYWSSTTYFGSPTVAYCISWAFVITGFAEKTKGDIFYVWPVRGGND